MIAPDWETIKSMESVAIEIASYSGQIVRMVKFENRKEITVIYPAQRQG